MKVEVRDLTFRYPKGQNELFEGFNFTLEPGEITCLLGPSGAGKSTLLKLIAGLLPGYQGHIDVGGEPLGSKNQDYYQSLGVLFENPGFFDRLTVIENLKYFAGFYTHRLKPEGLIHRLGLESVTDTLGEQLSQGMGQRLGLARALIHDPSLILLDEPTTGLDPLHVDRVVQLLKELRGKGKTILITTHQMAFVEQVADRVALLSSGKLFELGTLDAVIAGQLGPVVEVVFHNDQGRQSEQFPIKGLAENARFLALLAEPRMESIHSLDHDLSQIFKQLTGNDL